MNGAVEGVNGSSYALTCGRCVSRSGVNVPDSPCAPYDGSAFEGTARGSGADTRPLGVCSAAGRSPSSVTCIARSSRASAGMGSCSTAPRTSPDAGAEMASTPIAAARTRLRTTGRYPGRRPRASCYLVPVGMGRGPRPVGSGPMDGVVFARFAFSSALITGPGLPCCEGLFMSTTANEGAGFT